jgi:hypothetical protein
MSSQLPDRSAGDTLPDVKPPTAGFLIQLFVVPAMIVLIIVLVWLAIKWLTMDAGDPHKYLEQIRTNTRNRWNVALQLATALADPRYDSIKLDGAYMSGLADVLAEELDRPSDPNDPMQIRVYLCRALGQFRTSEGLPVLVRAATQQRDAASIEGRIAAVEAIGRLAENIRGTLTTRLLPQSAKTARELAQRMETGGDAAQAADELIRTARTTADFGAKSAELAKSFADLADRAERNATPNAVSEIGAVRELAAAIARQSKHAANLEAPRGSDVFKALVEAVDESSPALQFDERFDKEIDRTPMLREVAAISLGLVGGPDALAKLEEVVARQRGLLRYNAAAGLSRAGRATPDVIEALIEMLTEPDVQYDEPAKVTSDQEKQQLKEAARQQTVHFALGTIRVLVEANPTADVTALVAPLEKIAQSDPDSQLRIEAKSRLAEIQKR